MLFPLGIELIHIFMLHSNKVSFSGGSSTCWRLQFKDLFSVSNRTSVLKFSSHFCSLLMLNYDLVESVARFSTTEVRVQLFCHAMCKTEIERQHTCFSSRLNVK